MAFNLLSLERMAKVCITCGLRPHIMRRYDYSDRQTCGCAKCGNFVRSFTNPDDQDLEDMVNLWNDNN
jgi:hypothetical protein